MTLTILVRDVDSGYVGGAVLSHHPCVGSTVLAVESGVGVVAAQSFAPRSLARRTLRDLGSGLGFSSIQQTMNDEPTSHFWQLAGLLAGGEAFAMTGSRCVPYAGHRELQDLIVAGNMLVDRAVLDAAATAVCGGGGVLVDRLIAGLAAADQAGGDVRGRQAAAVVVASIDPAVDDRIELHVDDHPEPVDELARLARVHRAHRGLAEASRVARDGYLPTATAMFERFQAELGLANREPDFWNAVELARAGCVQESSDRLRRLSAEAPQWGAFARRVAQVGLAPPGFGRDADERADFR